MNNAQSDKNKKSIMQWLFPSIALIAFILATTIGFEKEMESKYREEVVSEFLECADDTVTYYDNEIGITENLCRVLAGYISENNIQSDKETLSGVLKAAESSSKVKKACYITSEGKCINSEGKTGSCEALLGYSSENLRSNTKLICGDVKNRFIVSNSVSGSDRLVLYCSLTDYDNLSYIRNNLASSSSTSTYLIIDMDDNIINVCGYGAKNYSLGKNLFDSINATNFQRGSEAKIQSIIDNGGSGYALYTNADGVSKYIAIKKFTSVENSIVILVSSQQVDKIVEIRNKPTSSLVIKVIICMAVFIGAIVLIAILNLASMKLANKDLQDQAETDLLTDLYNKITTEKKIDEYLSDEGKGKFSMMFLLDIDNFKKINDTMGHAFGDEVLSELGHQLRAEFRVTDIVGRLGGDEFVIFLKDIKDMSTVMRESQRINTFFKNFRVGEYTKYAATASIGVVLTPRDGVDFDTLYKAADQALYKAKKRGKKQLAFYRDVDANGNIIETEEDLEAARAVENGESLERING